jgi:hypothetical protein
MVAVGWDLAVGVAWNVALACAAMARAKSVGENVLPPGCKNISQ